MGGVGWLARKTSVVGALAMTSAGCAHLNMEIFKDVPTYRVDTFASEVTLQRKDGEAVPSDSASVARVEIAGVLNELMKDRTDVKNAQPARFRARIVETEQGRYDLTFGFQMGERFFATQLEAPTIKEGVHVAMCCGVYPKAQAMPQFYVHNDRPLMIGFGIPLAVIGVIPLTMGILFAANQDAAEGITLGLLGTALVSSGIALVVTGYRWPPPKARRAQAPRASVRVGPMSVGVRVEF